MDKLEELRMKIDDVDKGIALLFEKRMKLAKEIGELKKESGLPVYDQKREQAVIEKNLKHIDTQELKEYYEELVKTLMKLSKEYQAK